MDAVLAREAAVAPGCQKIDDAPVAAGDAFFVQPDFVVRAGVRQQVFGQFRRPILQRRVRALFIEDPVRTGLLYGIPWGGAPGNLACNRYRWCAPSAV